MKNQSKHLRHKQTLPTQFHSQFEDQELKDSSRFFYDTFEFQDRVTNNRFQYGQARQNRDLNLHFQEWTEKAKSNIPHVKSSLNIYKFTKKFEMNCIRSKYFRQTHNINNEKQNANGAKNEVLMSSNLPLSKAALFQINKKQLRRVLQTDDHVNSDILELNRCKNYLPDHLKLKKIKENSPKWNFGQGNLGKQNDSNLQETENQKRIKQRILNHMKIQIKENCEYLLNVPIEKKRKNLFKSQLKRQKSHLRDIISKYIHPQIQESKFTNLSADLISSNLKQQIKDNRGKQILSIVKKGYLNEAFLQLKQNPHFCLIKDEIGNNIFHLATKQGNLDMIHILFKAISPKSCLSLLSEKNNLKRTPKDKAVIFGYKQIVGVFDLFAHENRHFL